MSENVEAETSAAPTEPVHVESPADFKQKVEKYDVVFVDFHADWCGPCKMLEPIVEELAAETPAAILKVDVDEQQELAAQFQIRGVPTTALFVDGNPEELMVGVRDKGHYRQLIDQFV